MVRLARYFVILFTALIVAAAAAQSALAFGKPRPKPPVAAPNPPAVPRAEKEWTLLVFLNGHNNLDRFGFEDLNEMETVGSTDHINVVVQWASLKNKKTHRLLVRKDDNPKTVTSPLIETMDPVDMGDWKELVEFVRWGVKNFPAKRYFVDVWNHGGGWHLATSRAAATLKGASRLATASRSGGVITPSDISSDDLTGNIITTEQLGEAMREVARILGRKVDLYGSDACLMGMIEVAEELRDGVSVFLGSEENEPGKGWPYDAILTRWAAVPGAAPREVATILTEEFVRSYRRGSQGNAEVTMAAFDLDRSERLISALSRLSAEIRYLPAEERSRVVGSIRSAQHFDDMDYRDLMDFLGLVEASGVQFTDPGLFAELRTAFQDARVINMTTTKYARATGLAMWMPESRSYYEPYSARYKGLRFDRRTSWTEALESMLAQ